MESRQRSESSSGRVKETTGRGRGWAERQASPWISNAGSKTDAWLPNTKSRMPIFFIFHILTLSFPHARTSYILETENAALTKSGERDI